MLFTLHASHANRTWYGCTKNGYWIRNKMTTVSRIIIGTPWDVKSDRRGTASCSAPRHERELITSESQKKLKQAKTRLLFYIMLSFWTKQVISRNTWEVVVRPHNNAWWRWRSLLRDYVLHSIRLTRLILAFQSFSERDTIHDEQHRTTILIPKPLFVSSVVRRSKKLDRERKEYLSLYRRWCC